MGMAFLNDQTWHIVSASEACKVLVQGFSISNDVAAPLTRMAITTGPAAAIMCLSARLLFFFGLNFSGEGGHFGWSLQPYLVRLRITFNRKLIHYRL